MRTPSDRLFPSALMCGVSLCLALSLPAIGQTPRSRAASGAAGVVSDDASRRELRQSLERRYEALPILDGVLLRPRVERLGVKSIEVSGDSLVVNGARVSPEVLRSWLGEDGAEPVLRLHALLPADRQVLFGLKRELSPAPLAPDAAGGGAGRAQPAPGTSPAGQGRDAAPAAPPAPEPPQPPETTAEAPEQPQPPEPTKPHRHVSSGSRVRFAGPVTVSKDEVAEEVVAFGGPVRIDGEVTRDVSAVGGPVRINGRVGGDVKAVGGNIHLGPTSEVMGDVKSVGGTIVRAPGAKVHGSTSDAPGVMPFKWWGHEVDDGLPWGWGFSLGNAVSLFWSMIGVLVLALIVCLILLVARPTVERLDVLIIAEPWKAGAVGLAGQILFLPLLAVVTVLLVISIIGCALFLLYPFVFLALIVAGLVGFTAVCLRLGRWMEVRFTRSFGGPYAAALIGLFVVEIWSLIGRFFAAAGGPLNPIGLIFLIFGAGVRYVTWTVGFGAVILFALTNRPRRRRLQPGAPAPSPPNPAAPATHESPPQPPPAQG